MCHHRAFWPHGHLPIQNDASFLPKSIFIVIVDKTFLTFVTIECYSSTRVLLKKK